MKFIVDEQLPRKLVSKLIYRGYEAIHADDIPHIDGKLSDLVICKFADSNDYVVISKDEDFWQRYLLMKEPNKLIYVTTGNIRNMDLLILFEKNLNILVQNIALCNVIEINRLEMIIHF